LLTGDEPDNINQQSGQCAPVCASDQYLENFVCVAKKMAGEYCWDNYYYGPGGSMDEEQRENPMCTSGKCGGSSGNNYMMSMSPYCCSDPACEKLCDQGTGACTTKSMPGEACSNKVDCYGEHACLGGKCCSFTHSEWSSSSNSNGTMHYNSYNNERISNCTACGGTDEKDRSGFDRPGQCTSCAAGSRFLTGDEPDNINQQSGQCAPVCASDQYLENFVCVAKKMAGEYCWDNYYYGPGGSMDEEQRENPMCTSGKCGGSSGNNYMMSMSPYCCSDPACEKLCDQGTGACTTKSMPGEACSNKVDCYGEHACLGGKCCSFTHSEWSSSSNSNGTMHYNSYNNERISNCTACGGTDEKDRSGFDRPGQCTSCAAGSRLLTGKETDVNNGWESGICGPVCASDHYLDAGMWPMRCVARKDAGNYW